MKHTFHISGAKWLVVGVLLLLIALPSVGRGPGGGGGGGGVGGGISQGAALTDAEREWLMRMREEEKMARDVYIFCYAQWGARVFDSISRAEQMHMNMLKTQLDRYGIPDPAAGKGQGQFTNTQLQALYNQLIAQAKISLKEALKVGVIVEQVDIADLNSAMAVTDHGDINRVYTHLRQGSYHHLDAFNNQLAR